MSFAPRVSTLLQLIHVISVELPLLPPRRPEAAVAETMVPWALLSKLVSLSGLSLSVVCLLRLIHFDADYYDVPEGHRRLTFVLHAHLDLPRTLNFGFFSLFSYGIVVL